MKSKMNIKNIIIIAVLGIISLFFINMSLAANIGKVSVETANLRETADENAKILELLSMNDQVEIIEKTGEWYKVKAKGITGYLRQDIVSVDNEEVEEKNTTSNNLATQDVQTTQTSQTNVTEQGEIGLGKQKVAQDTKLKIVPVINATDIIEVKQKEEVEVIEIVNGWACVETQNTKGWLRKERLEKIEKQSNESEQAQLEQQSTQQNEQTEKAVIKTLYVNATTVNVRKEASTSAEIVTNVPINTAVEVLAEDNGWSEVKVNGKEGYISSSLLSTTKQQSSSRGSATPRKEAKTTNVVKNSSAEVETSQASSQAQVEQAPVTGEGSSVVAYAQQFIGIPYTYGGSSPSTGFDCSGFTSYVYKNFGVSLPRTSGGQAKAGVSVSKDNLAAGDLIIYSGHVAIYVGGGQVIHAPRPGKNVCIVPLGQAAGTYLGARRVI